MDKLKVYLAVLKKHHFWVLCGVIVIVSLGSWLKASSELQAKFKTDATKVDATDRTLDQLGPGSPNETYSSGLNKEQQTLKGKVLDAWKIFGQDQHDKLKWPEAVAEIGKLGPEEQIPENLRENFMRLVVKAEWKRLFDKVNLRRQKGAPATGGLPGDRGVVVEFEGIVNWDAGRREDIMRRHQYGAVAETIRVRTIQEDLWVYESLIDIILAMNTGATDQLNAVIKRVDILDVAQWAVLDAQKVPGAEVEVRVVEAAPGMGGAGVGMDEGYVKIPGGEAQPGEEKKLSPDQQLIDGRYLDEKSQPASAEAISKNPPFAEFKQLFVNMQFLMDQRRIPDLLAACANSYLPIDTRQVLLHFNDIDSGKAGAEVAAVDPAHKGEHGPYDATVQIRGIIYIYNEPSEARLGTGSAANPAKRSMGIPVPKAAEAAAPAIDPSAPVQ